MPDDFFRIRLVCVLYVGLHIGFDRWLNPLYAMRASFGSDASPIVDQIITCLIGHVVRGDLRSQRDQHWRAQLLPRSFAPQATYIILRFSWPFGVGQQQA